MEDGISQPWIEQVRGACSKNNYDTTNPFYVVSFNEGGEHINEDKRSLIPEEIVSPTTKTGKVPYGCPCDNILTEALKTKQ